MKNKTEISINSKYPTFNEYNRKQFLNIATAVGIGVSATAISLDVEAKSKKKVTESEKGKVTEQLKLRKQVEVLVANLGNKEFKEREQATVSLIAIGKGFIKDKKCSMTEFLTGLLKKQKSSKDPEVKQRAKKILIAITPPPPQIPVEAIDGGIPIAGDIAF